MWGTWGWGLEGLQRELWPSGRLVLQPVGFRLFLGCTSWTKVALHPSPATKVIWKQWLGKVEECLPTPMPTVHLKLLQDV